MSYMRGDPYVYESDRGLELHHDESSQTWDVDTFDALALMRVAELLEEPERIEKVTAIATSNLGNFGAGALMKIIGLPSGWDVLRTSITKALANRRDEFEVCDKCGTFLQAKEKKDERVE